MEIIINQQTTTVMDNCSLQQLLDYMLPQQQGIAVAVNQTIVPKVNWAAQQLQPHDNIMLITATQGG